MFSPFIASNCHTVREHDPPEPLTSDIFNPSFHIELNGKTDLKAYLQINSGMSKVLVFSSSAVAASTLAG